MLEAKTTVDKALDHLRQGRMLVVRDKNDRENEGDALMAASFATAEKVNFMITHCKGLVCAPISESLAQKLNLPPMWQGRNQGAISTNFTVAVDHTSCRTGISAAERACTLAALAHPEAEAGDFHRPGHVFPNVAHAGGLAERQGHTEMAIHLLQKAKLPPVGVICEIINANGTMARGEQLRHFAQKHELMLLSIEDILQSLSSQ